MKSVVICEKPSQARNLTKALGTQYGKIIAFAGHIIGLQEPHEENSNWLKWTDDVLKPDRGFYKTKVDPSKRAILNTLKEELKTADVVIIATDSDREGQLIGQEALDILGWKGQTKRAMFYAEDPISLQNAFKNLEDNSKYENRYQAARSRQQTDQIYNLTLTRVVTNNLKKFDGTRIPIGIGRVKTPTMGIVCSIEDKISNFIAEGYWVVELTAEGTAGKITLRHGGVPTGDSYLKTEENAKALATAASKYNGPITMKMEKKERKPPRPLDMAAMQTMGNSVFSWTVDKVLEVAQSLYEKHNLITYPRGESRYIPVIEIPNASVLLDRLKSIKEYASYSLPSPQIRQGKDGVYFNDGSPHYAIIPNVNAMLNKNEFLKTHASLNSDEARLYDMIARQFLAAIGENSKYNSTEASLPVMHDSENHKFIARGQITTYPGFLEILKNQEKDDDEENQKIPKFNDQDPVKAIGIKLITEETKAPARLSEGQLITAMKDAWKYIENKEESERLKEAKGIGTPATRSTIIKGLKTQNLLSVVGKKIMPSPGAMEIYYTLRDITPWVLDPGSTARLEKILDCVETGQVSMQQAINDTCKITQKSVDEILNVKGKVKIDMTVKAMRPGKAGKKTPATTPSPNNNTTPKTAKTANKSTPAKNQTTTNANVGGTLIKVPFDKKDEAKALGAKWDMQNKSWYIPNGIDPSEFKKKGWLN